MFNDFEDSAPEEGSKGRKAVSLGVAAIMFLLIGSGIAAAMATVRVVQRERDQEVSFADLPMQPLPEPEVEEPPPPPPPPPPRRVRRNRPAGRRPVLDRPPTEIPDEIPEEADGDLSETEGTGPVDNDAEMGEGGDGEAPAPEPAPVVTPEPPAPRPAPRPAGQVRETIRRARFLADRSGCRRIIIPDDVAAALGAQTVRLRIRALVDPQGNVASARIVNGHPAIPEDLVLRCAEQWAFAPATLPDGTAVPYPAIRTFVIRPRT